MDICQTMAGIAVVATPWLFLCAGSAYWFFRPYFAGGHARIRYHYPSNSADAWIINRLLDWMDLLRPSNKVGKVVESSIKLFTYKFILQSSLIHHSV